MFFNSMRGKILITVINLLLLISLSCEEGTGWDELNPEGKDVLTPQNQPKEPFLNKVEKIEIEYDLDAKKGTDDVTYYSSGNFYYEPDKSVAYMMFGVFNGSIEVSSGNKISSDNLLAGHRTGLANFSRTKMPVKNLLKFSQSKQDFTSTKYVKTGSIAYKVAVWGYNDKGSLTHASPPIDIIIDWDK